MQDKNEFKVVDKRASSGATDDKHPAADNHLGEGFVMKDRKSEPPSEVDFSTFVLSLATSALLHMGYAPEGSGLSAEKVEKNLEVAKQNIDLLALLKEKTKNNLTTEEEALLTHLLTEARLRYVEASR